MTITTPTPRQWYSVGILLCLLFALTQLSLAQVGASGSATPSAKRHGHGKAEKERAMLLNPRILVMPISFDVEHNPAPAKSTESLVIENQGTSALIWTIEEAADSCDDPADLPWVSVSSTGGGTPPSEPSILTVKFNSFDLPDGDYMGWLCITSNDPVEPLVAVRLSLKVEFPVTPTPTRTPPTIFTRTPTRTPTLQPNATSTPTRTPVTIFTRTPTRTATVEGQTEYDLYLPVTRRR